MVSVVRLLVIALFAAGCALVEAPAAGPLVTVEATGGHCREGTCRSVVAIEADGRVHQIEPAEMEIHQVTGESIDVLRHGDRRHGLRGDPLAAVPRDVPDRFDGQELIYTVATAHGPERIASCEVEVDPQAPLFTAIHAILGANLPVPAP